ncbi:MAG: energy transducer TonB [Alphaproteobacteria bacterium]|nr:energy transducer TonB [Alphaproteobacteria bacterium]
MFDTVGRSTDTEATRRSFASLLLTSLILGGTGAFVLGVGALQVTKVTREPVPDPEPMVEVDLRDDFAVEAPPPPPPPPPAAAAPEPDAASTVEPDELDDRVKELVPDVRPEVATQDRPAGREGGEDGGVEDGEVGGMRDGTPGGELGGDPDGGPPIRVFHHSEVEKRRSPPPEYPNEAVALGLGAERCDVLVRMDDRGVPTHVEVSRCHPVFAEAARQAILRWRWYPPKVGGQRVAGQTRIAVRFQADP